ncbi:hypothetical protein J2I47_09145 [Fibrella sp. HMF5335]|uniref:T9SS type A sorting domain-containing protein n=1 Tax=Fibrella rubiginis TaxID=2817060 RepID=A0A939GHS3_9BACT|nr:hypothetical protein [Fibrella rubiginis]MBO0936708.1 hypothetical protein [Fibrella rubiginis]
MKTFRFFFLLLSGLAGSFCALGQPTITMTSTIPTPICPGASASLKFNVNDTRAADNKYALHFYLSSYPKTPSSQAEYDQAVAVIYNLGSFVSTSGGKNNRSADFTMPKTLPGGAYKVFIVSQSDVYFNDFFSNIFTLKPLTTLTISGNPTITAGTPALINISLTGTAPWTFDYNDYSEEYRSAGFLRTATVNTLPYAITPRMPTFSTPIIYNNVYVRNLRDASGCPGPNTVSGSATVTATPLELSTFLDKTSVCAGGSLNAQYATGNSSIRLQADFKPIVQLSDASGNFGNPINLATGALGTPTTAVTIPGGVAAGNYRIRIIAAPATPDQNVLIVPRSAAITITKADKPIVANTNPTVCQGEASVTLSATGAGTLKWFDFAGNGLAGPPTQGTGTAGSYGYSVAQVLGGCESERVGITLKVKAKPAAPVVQPKSLCQNDPSYTLQAGGNNLRWFNSSDGLWNGNGSTPVVSTGSVGTQTFKVDREEDGCRSDKATVIVTVNAPPAAPIVANPAAVCQYTDAPNLTANGQNLKWYATETGGSGTATLKPNTDQPGTTAYWVSQTDKGCEGPRAKIDQTINLASPDPTFTTNLVLLCKDQTTTPVTALGQNLKWYDANGNTALAAAPTPSTTQTGDIKYRVSQTSNGCESKKVELLVQVRNTPGAPGVVPVSLCQNQTAKPLTPTGDGLSWYEQETNGTSQTALTPQTGTLGEKAYWVSQRFGACEGPRAKLIATVYPVPDKSVAAGKDFCVNDPATALVAGGDALRWYTTADRSSPAQASITPATDKSQNVTYYVTQTRNGCESAPTAVVVRVRAKAVATLSGDDKVFAYDSTAIRIRLAGDGPWSFTLWNGQAITTETTPFVKWVTPNPTAATATYKLLGIRNDCGTGDVGNAYTLTIQQPLATEPAPGPLLSLLLYPSPATTQCTLAWQAPAGVGVTLRLITLTGRVAWQVQRTGTGQQQTDVVDLSQLAAGLFFADLQTTDAQRKTSTLLKQ